MKILIVLCAVIGALYKFYPDIFSFGSNKGAFDEQGNPQTLVFTVDKCSRYCDEALDLLNKRHIEYTEYNVEESEANKAIWKEYSSKVLFPTVITGDEATYGYYKSQIVSALATYYGDSALTSTERFYFKKHFYPDGSPRLVVYGATWCNFCKKLRAVLNENGIDFYDINVDISPQEKAMTKAMEITGFPLIYYGYERLRSSKPDDVLAMF